MDFQDSMDDIDQAPGSVERVVALYDDGNDDDLTTTDENDGDRDDEVAGKASDSGATQKHVVRARVTNHDREWPSREKKVEGLA